MQKNVQYLWNKPMDRRQFLTHIAVGLMLITGFSTVIKGLAHLGEGKPGSSLLGQPDLFAGHGFGSRKFGD